MKRILLPLAVLPFLALGACSGEGGTPCEGEFTYSNGSMPPPHSYSWTVTFDDASGSVVWTSPYAEDEPEWSADFVPDPDAVVALCDAIREAPKNADTVGGAIASWETSAGSDHTDSGVDELEAAAIELVGTSTYEELEAQFQAWRAEQD